MSTINHDTVEAPGYYVRAASYWRYRPPYFADSTLESSVPAFGAALSLQAKQLLARVGPAWTPAHFVVCSTIISPLLTEGGEHTRAFKNELRDTYPGAAPHIVNGYECASWGYVMRHYGAIPSTGRLLLCIADIDVHQFHHWTDSEIWKNLWGHTGFGITTLCLECPTGSEGLTLSPGAGAGSMMEFAKSVKAHMAAAPDATVCPPFFPVKTRQMFEKLVGGPPLLPDLHSEYGHCFGSDPWIALISRLAGSPRTRSDVIVASLAFNGYHAVANVRVDGSTYLESRDCGAMDDAGGPRKPADALTPTH